MASDNSQASNDQHDVQGEMVDRLATSSPPKDLRTLMASGHAVEQADAEEHVRQRAYDLWEAAGRPPGNGAEFWDAAERELLGEKKASSGDERP